MIIGIGGVSRSGKSTLAEIINSIFNQDRVVIIPQDNYVFDEEAIPEIRGEVDWECPESIDFPRYKSALEEASEFNDVIIADGLLAFYDEEINQLYDKRIFVSVGEKIFRERKVSDLRWGSYPHWYIDHIWESYLKYGKINVNSIDYFHLDGSKSFDKDLIKEYLTN
ncbi:MAG: hypothetical protein QNK30_07905 [Bacteroidales bacterium]|nr:hypothetical protein [Bacteroidales bacterium]